MDLDRLIEHETTWRLGSRGFDWWNQVNLTELEACQKIIHDSGKFMLCHNGATWQGISLRTQYRIPDGFMVEHSTQIYRPPDGRA